MASDAEPQDLAACIGQIAMIRVDFPSFADGRGFTIAAQLRRMGYQVEIDADLAKRQPEDQWLARANWKANDYQSRLRG